MRDLELARVTWWREWRTHGAILLAGPLALLGGLALSEPGRLGWYPFVALFLAPLIALGLGATGDPRADRWWAGLGGSRATRVLARSGLHLLVIAGTLLGALLLALHTSFTGEDGGRALLLMLGCGLLAVSALYLSAAAARLFAGGFGALSGPIWLGTLVVLAGRADWALSRWSLLEGAAIRLTLLSGLGLGALIWGDGRLLRTRHATWLTLASAALVGGSVAAHAAWSGPPLLLRPELRDVGADGRRLYLYPVTPGILPRRAWIAEGDDLRPVGPVGTWDGWLGPAGSSAFFASDPLTGSGDGRLVLRTADGIERSCAFSRLGDRSRNWRFQADGSAVVVRTFDADGAERQASVHADGTCAEGPADPMDGTWNPGSDTVPTSPEPASTLLDRLLSH